MSSTLKEINDLLIELAKPYEQSPMFERTEEPIAAEDDSSMSITVYFKEQIVIITCDREMNISEKKRKRKISKAEDVAVNGYQMSFDDMLKNKETDDSVNTKIIEDKIEAEAKPNKTVQNPEESKQNKAKVSKEITKPVSKSKSSSSSEGESANPFKVGDIVTSIYSSTTKYTVEKIKGYTCRCHVVGQKDAFIMTAADLVKIDVD